MNEYGPVFSERYVYQQGQWLYTTIGPLIKRFYESTPVGSEMHKMLDLGCGSGLLLNYFAENDYQATGFDLSRHMVDIAKKKNKRYIKNGLVDVKLQDVTHFVFPSPVGLITEIGQIFNHLPDIFAVKSCCGCIYNALAEGGYFIGDILLETAPTKAQSLKAKVFENIFSSPKKIGGWTHLSVQDDQKAFSLTVSLYDPILKKNVCHDTGFFRSSKKTLERYQETHYLTYYYDQQLLDLFKAIGFRKIYFAEMADFGKPKKPRDIQGFRFIVAQK
jgi:SAM-dependent methyltransferase